MERCCNLSGSGFRVGKKLGGMGTVGSYPSHKKCCLEFARFSDFAQVKLKIYNSISISASIY